jgi:hypothetical protein
MPTQLEHVPTLVERIVGAHLIVIGRVAGLREVRRAEGFDRTRTFGLFDVDVNDVLYGEPPDRLILRVLSDPEGDSEGERIRWVVPMEVGAPVLLLLARDVAPELPDDVYVPYFTSVFSVEDEEWVVIPDDALDEPTREIAGDDDDRGRVHLAGLRRLVDTVTAENDERRRAVEELLPAQLVRGPYPLVLEQSGVEQPSQRGLPEVTPDGGRPGEEEWVE